LNIKYVYILDYAPDEKTVVSEKLLLIKLLLILLGFTRLNW